MDDTIHSQRVIAQEQAIADLQAELAASRGEIDRIRHHLGERVKELTCLYQVSSLLQHPLAVSEMMRQVVALLVPAWQFPEIACARIRLCEESYATEPFAETPWCLSALFYSDDTPVGLVEVFYREARPDADEGPFLPEERRLLDAVAEMLTRWMQRRRVDDALLDSESKYRALIDNLYEGVWLADHRNNTVFLNQRMAELLGYAPEEVVGRNVLSFLDPEERAAGERYISERGIHETEFTRRDGSRVWLRVASTPFFDAEGRYQGALAGVVDITERKRMEAQLLENEERFRRQAAELETIYWWAPVGLAVVDDEMRYLRINRRLAEINGLPAEHHIGKTMSEIAPGIAPQAERIHQWVLEKGEPALEVEFNALSIAERGMGRCWNTQWLPLKDAHGRVWGINVVVEEITARKQWEERLFRREQEFEALAERSPDIIARIDRDERFFYVNRAVERVTGLERGWFIGKSLNDLPVPRDTRDLRKQAVEKVFDLGVEQTLEHSFESVEGIRHFHARLVPEFGRDGRVESALVVDRDITELKRVQQALEQLTLHDPLTGIANRRYLEQFIAREWRRATRHGYPMALIMVDIDGFKAYNDHYGHPQGDDCLREVAHALETHLHRASDLLVRYGGEEFLIVLPETGVAEARRLAEGLRQAVAAIAMPLAGSPMASAITASFGVVAAPAADSTFESLLAAADQALYRAKQEGRNRVASAEPAGAPPLTS